MSTGSLSGAASRSCARSGQDRHAGLNPTRTEPPMTAQPSISVRGEAVLEVDPEIAVISVAVMVRDKDRRRAVDLLAKRNGKVLAMVRALGEAVDKVESGAASVHREFKDGGRGKDRVTGYVARGNISVTISDFTVLGDL